MTEHQPLTAKTSGIINNKIKKTVLLARMERLSHIKLKSWLFSKRDSKIFQTYQADPVNKDINNYF